MVFFLSKILTFLISKNRNNMHSQSFHPAKVSPLIFVYVYSQFKTSDDIYLILFY